MKRIVKLWQALTLAVEKWLIRRQERWCAREYWFNEA
jgi:hypothetical protein